MAIEAKTTRTVVHCPECPQLMNQNPNPFIDPQGYKSYLARSEESFNEHLEQQQ
jgi:hypothetical protein